MFANLQPEDDSSEGEHSEIVVSKLLVASSHTTELLESVDEPLHTVAFAVDALIEASLALVALMGDGYPDPPHPQILAYPLAAVPPLQHQLAEW